MIRILALPRFTPLAAGCRYRIYSYLNYLRDQGFSIDVAPFLGDDYLHAMYQGRRKSYLSIASSYFNRVAQLLKLNRYDLVWIHWEALPWVPAWIESLLLKNGHRVIVDYDDALFHRYDSHRLSIVRNVLGKKVRVMMRQATMVIAGNDYLANYARESGSKCVRLLPTVVDLEKYQLAAPREEAGLNVGWIGTPVTARLLQEIQPALRTFCQDGTSRVTVVGAGDIRLEGVPVVVREWSEKTEVAEIQKFDIGIMPLSETDHFCRGKCGLKLIQYMACGVPVIGTPVGVNSEIIRHQVTGYQASTQEEWVHALMAMKQSLEHRRHMGLAGRQLVEQKYSLQRAAPRLTELFREALGQTDRVQWGKAA